MRKSIVIAVVIATLTGLVGASVTLAPVASAHPSTHQISIADKAAPEGTAAQQAPTSGTMTVSISPAPATGETIVVPWSAGETGNGPGHADGGPTPVFPTDFQLTQGQIFFTAGEESENITIPVTADHANEPDETFAVTLLAPVCSECAISDPQGIYTIQNDDAAETLSINDVSMNEGNIGTTTFAFTVTRSPGSTKTVTVQVSTSDGTATKADNDYEGLASEPVTLTFNPSHAASTQMVNVTVNGDGTPEGNETFFVNLSNATNATISDATGQGTIQNDDAAGPAMTISDASGPNAATEGNNLVFTVRLSQAPGAGQQAQVQYSTNDGTATQPGDYTDQDNQTLTFTAGQTQQQITVATTEDTVEENTETMSVVLTKPGVCCTGGYDYTIVDGTGEGTILDDDRPTFTIDDPSVVEGDPGDTQVVTFTVTKTGSSASPSTVTFSTAQNTALENVDYVSKTQTLTFDNTQPSQQQTVEVEVIEDVIDEPNETFFGRLSDVTNGTIADAEGVATITDDDQSLGIHDFNGDGFDDAAFGVPREDIGSKKDAGGVNVIYGSASRLRVTNPLDQFWSLGGLGRTAGANDRYGAAIAVGNFNGDAFADMAVGVPGASSGAGAVSVVYGSASGLAAAGNQLWTQDSTEDLADVEGEADAGDAFGFALTAADFNGDTRLDLAIGVPNDTVGGDEGAGAVNVLFGSVAGLTANGDQIWHQDNDGIGADDAETGDAFGRTLASGNLNGDNFADLVVGAPTENVTASNDGAATVLLGSGAGLTATGSQLWHQDVEGVEDQAEASDVFALALAVGDFNGDGTDDLAAGVPFEDGGGTDTGAVNVLFGSSGIGLVVSNDQVWTQDSPGIADSTQDGDRFGSALAAADFDNDARDDLGIGVPREDYSGNSKINAGVVSVLYGSVGGLTATGDQLWHPDIAGVRGSGETSDLFGGTLATGDFNNNNSFDLVVGAYGEDIGSSLTNAGSSHVLYGSAAKLTASGDQVWNQDSTGVAGGAEKGDVFAQGLG